MTPNIPTWIQIFVLVGVGVVILLVPLRVFFEITKGARDRMGRLHDLADRLKERFGAVQVERWVFGLSRIHFTHEGRPAHFTQPDEEQLVLRLEPKVRPKFPVIIETRGRIDWRFAVMWDALRILPRVRTHDPLIDDTLAIYASGSFGGYLRELALDGIPSEGKPTGLAESLVVLRRLPGIRRMVFRMSPAGGFQLAFDLRSGDLLYRPDELEAAVYHAFRLHDLLVLR
ncbi:MAG TPA: hypothetical protein VJB14_15215 [Planctomycetota bacterium]|nr:hypothetical protein [Planctomycetota bacterium]